MVTIFALSILVLISITFLVSSAIIESSMHTYKNILHWLAQISLSSIALGIFLAFSCRIIYSENLSFTELFVATFPVITFTSRYLGKLIRRIRIHILRRRINRTMRRMRRLDKLIKQIVLETQKQFKSGGLYYNRLPLLKFIYLLSQKIIASSFWFKLEALYFFTYNSNSDYWRKSYICGRCNTHLGYKVYKNHIRHTSYSVVLVLPNSR